MKERVIQQVSFRPDGIVEIQYVEGYDQGEQVAKVSILAFDAEAVSVEEILSNIDDLIDLALDKLRNE